MSWSRRGLASLWPGHTDLLYAEPLVSDHFDDITAAGSYRRMNWPDTLDD